MRLRILYYHLLPPKAKVTIVFELEGKKESQESCCGFKSLEETITLDFTFGLVLEQSTMLAFFIFYIGKVNIKHKLNCFLYIYLR